MPIKYIPYFPETVDGQAILDNFVRNRRFLSYRDNQQVFEHIQRGMPYYELKEQESVGKNPDNLIIRGECISACAYLKEQNIKVDLVYIDPPFASGADYAKKVFLRPNPKIAQAIQAAETELNNQDLKAFEEKMYGDIWQKEDYLNWLFENLMAIKSILSDTGSIFLHLDWHISHYAKILMDEVFGEENLVNEIIWWYPSGSDPSKNFNRKHDNIFWYTKNKDSDYTFNFNDVAIPYNEAQTARFSEWDEEKQNWFYWNKNPRGERVKTFKKLGIGEYDVWNIGIDATGNKNIGYATSKPPKLLERIIKAASNKDMLIADFFGGSGITAKVAHDLGRKFIHTDVGLNSVQIVRDRLKNQKAQFKVLDIQDGLSLFRNPQQTMDKLSQLIPGLQKKMMGLGKFWYGSITKTKDGNVPVYIPNLINSQEKTFHLQLLHQIINQEIPQLKIPTKKIIAYYVDIENRQEIDNYIKKNNVSGVEIELLDLKNLLHHVVFEDIIVENVLAFADEYIVEIVSFLSDRLSQKIEEFNQKKILQSNKNEKRFNPLNISESGLELIEYITLDCHNQEGSWHSSSEIKIDKNGFITLNGEKTKQLWDGKIAVKQKPIRLKIRNIAGDETIKKLL
jgi:adenine-specific DNA-methyltransferase